MRRSKSKTDSGIYALTSRGRILYVGQSVSLNRRRTEHLEALAEGTHPNGNLRAYARRHGHKSIGFRIIERCNKRSLNRREAHHIARLHPSCNIVWPDRSLIQRDRAGKIINKPKPSPVMQGWEEWLAVAIAVGVLAVGIKAL